MVQLVTLLHPIFRSIYAYLFPNFMLNRYGPWLDTNAVVPTGETDIVITSDLMGDTHMMSAKYLDF